MAHLAAAQAGRLAGGQLIVRRRSSMHVGMGASLKLITQAPSQPSSREVCALSGVQEANRLAGTAKKF